MTNLGLWDGAYSKTRQYGNDGVMMGRRLCHHPSLFNPGKKPISVEEKPETFKLHIE